MKKILLLSVAVMAVASVFSQRTINDPNAEVRKVAAFHAIEVGGGIDLYLSQGEDAVAVSASETKYRDKISTEVVNGVLKIRYEWEKGFKFSINTRMRLKAYVSCKDLDKLSAGGGSDVQIEGVFKVASLDLHVSGGSDFDGKVDIGTLKANASGGSDIKISGSAKSLEVDASGGSDFHGYNLTAETCDVDASGGSDVFITATKELNVESSGGSDIHYKGSAVINNIRTSGGGSVKKSS